jgi:hypothetical protein
VLQQPTLVTTDPGSDGLPGGISHSVAVRCSKSWLLVPSEDSGPEEDIYDGLELHPPWMRDFLDHVPGAVVMPRCSSRARSLPAGPRASTPKDSTSSASRYIFSSSVSLGGSCSSSALSSMPWFPGCCCSSAGEPWAKGLSGTNNSMTKGSSSCDAC